MIRPYQVSDKRQVVELFRLNTPKYFDLREQADFEKYLEEHGETYFVFEENKAILGCGGYHFTNNGTVGRISWDIIHPNSKKRGIGRQLISHCLAILQKEPSVTTLAVWTSQLACDFYGKFGFATKEIKKDFWGPGLDLYKMEINLTV